MARNKPDATEPNEPANTLAPAEKPKRTRRAPLSDAERLADLAKQAEAVRLRMNSQLGEQGAIVMEAIFELASRAIAAGNQGWYETARAAAAAVGQNVTGRKLELARLDEFRNFPEWKA